jgi:hypothetical protein
LALATERLMQIAAARRAAAPSSGLPNCLLVLPDQPLLWAVEGLRSSLAAAASQVCDPAGISVMLQEDIGTGN